MLRQAVVLVALLFAGCSGANPATPTSPTAPAATPSVNASSLPARELRIDGAGPGIGQIVVLTATLTSSTANPRDVGSQATWHSSNLEVALVLPPGRVTAVGVGEVEITATFDGITGSKRFSIAAPMVDRIKFQFAAGVPETTKTSVMDGARIAQDYFQATLGRNVAGETNVIFTTEPSPFALGQSVVTNSAAHTITFYPLGWSTPGVHVMVHELFHVLQAEMNWPGMGSIGGTADLPGVRWLSEGAAEYVAVRALSDRGIYNLSSYMSGRRSLVCSKSLPALRDLEDLNTFYTAPNSYTLAMLGAEILTSENLHRFAVYWTAVASMTWQEAFQPAFGMTLSEFYVRSEEQRRNGCR